MTDRLGLAFDAINKYISSALAHPQAPLIEAKCRGLMAGYEARWQNQPYLFESVEQMVHSHLWNPETQRKSRSFRLAGVPDATGWHGERRVLLDHKTTSEDIADPNAPYWRQLVVEAQPSHYMLLEWLNGRKVDMAVWDVVRKPTISPKAISAKRDIADILATGYYFGRQISAESLQQLRDSGREDSEMYEARLAHDCTSERPDWYFQRRPVPRLDAEIHEWATDLWGHSQDLLYARRENRWPKNSGACMLYKRACKFLGICSGYDTTDSDKWIRKQQVHAELPILEGDGRDVLTNSRIRSFQTCRRKHYYEYELGIERVDEEEAESLYFGSCWHAALAAWFSTFVKEQDGDSNEHDSPVGEIGTAADSEAPVYF